MSLLAKCTESTGVTHLDLGVRLQAEPLWDWPSVRILIDLLVLISKCDVISHLFWRAALASVRFVRKVFWEGWKQTGVSGSRTGSTDR